MCKFLHLNYQYVEEKEMIPTRIYLCGGGVNVIAHVGVLKELQRHSTIHIGKIKEWMGVSAGALMALCLVIGYTCEELEQFFLGFDFRNVTDIDSAPGWIINYGMDTGIKLRKFVEACLHIKGISETITFEELYNHTHLRLRAFVTDLNTGKLIPFSYDTTPKRNVVEAVCASMSLPYYFQPIIDPETNHYLMDGVVVSNYPLFMLSEHELRETLGIYFHSKPASVEEFKIEDFALRPIQIMLNMRGQQEIRQFNENTIIVPVGSRSAVHFDIDEKEKKELLRIGHDAVRTYLVGQRKRIQRRYSVS